MRLVRKGTTLTATETSTYPQNAENASAEQLFGNAKTRPSGNGAVTISMAFGSSYVSKIPEIGVKNSNGLLLFGMG